VQLVASNRATWQWRSAAPLLRLAPVSVESVYSVVCRLGYKVALVDADIGLRNLDLLLGLENRVLYTAIDILDGECR
jgi:hypothetical protein